MLFCKVSSHIEENLKLLLAKFANDTRLDGKDAERSYKKHYVSLKMCEEMLTGDMITFCSTYKGKRFLIVVISLTERRPTEMQ